MGHWGVEPLSDTSARSRESFSEFASWNSVNLNMCFSWDLVFGKGGTTLERLACRKELDRKLRSNRPKPALTFLHSGFFRYLMPKQDKCFVTGVDSRGDSGL